MSNETFAQKFTKYEAAIPQIFATGTDKEVAQIAVNIAKLTKSVQRLRALHDSNFDQIATGIHPERSDLVKRIRKASDNATPVEPMLVEVVENDPLAGEF